MMSRGFAYLAKLQDDILRIRLCHQLEVLDRGLCYPTIEVQTVGAQLQHSHTIQVSSVGLVVHFHQAALAIT